MNNPSHLLPIEIAGLKVRHLKWSDFKGQVDESMPWSAHIYWWIEYQITDYKKKKISVKLHINPKSWVRPEKKCDHLLNHQQGHYLIGSLCALQFLRRFDKKKRISQANIEELALQTFQRTMKEYLEMEKQYDKQTQHRLHYKKQEEWDTLIFDKLTYYLKTYDKSQNKFVKISDSPNKAEFKKKQSKAIYVN